MSTGADSSPSQNRSVRQSARQRASELRSRQKRKDLLGRSLLIGAGVILVAAIIVGLTMLFTTTEPSAKAGPENMVSGGAIVGAELKTVRSESLPIEAENPATALNPAVPNIRIYQDFLCKDCGKFEQENGEMLKKMVQDGTVTVEYHPVATLTNKSAGSQYSQRSANAFACVANYSPDSIFAFNAALFADQPTEGTAGHDDKKLAEIARGAGADAGSDLTKCIDKVTYKTWVSSMTERALKGPIPNSKVEKLAVTPTILVNDKQYTGSPLSNKELRAFILSIASETQNKATASATPTVEPAPEETPAP